MIDPVKLPVPTMAECSLDDLPITLADNVRCFLADNEIPNLCVLRKIEVGWVYIYAVTPSCVITIVNKIKNGVLISDDWENESSCIFLSAIKKIEFSWGKNEGKVTLRGETLVILESYRFLDVNLLKRFESTIFSLIKQNRLHS